jgi:ribosome-interacting GTPase 1
MPTNLPPEYFAVEHRYKEAGTPEEKAAALEELIGTIPKHKGTDKLRADLRKKLSKLKAAAQSKKGVSKHESLFLISHEGAGQVAVIGSANTGKSAFVAAVTHATPEVEAFPFSTWKPTPGMMPFKDIQIQLIDTPPLDREYLEPDLFDLIRRADMALIVVDIQGAPVDQLMHTAQTLVAHKIIPAPLSTSEHAEQRGMINKPCLVLLNKNDDADTDENIDIFCALLDKEWPYIAASTQTGRNLDTLKRELFERLRIMRIYSKAPGKKPDLDAPFVLKQGSTVEEFAGKVHQDFVRNLKAARVWGIGVYDGQHVQHDHVLHDGDIVELHM